VLVQHAPNIVRVIEKVDKRRAMRNSLDGKTAKIYPGVQSLHMRSDGSIARASPFITSLPDQVDCDQAFRIDGWQ
jgi:hypothetical protein